MKRFRCPCEFGLIVALVVLAPHAEPSASADDATRLRRSIVSRRIPPGRQQAVKGSFRDVHMRCDQASETEAPSHRRNDDQQGGWKSLFDGTTLEGWKVTNFGGEGEVRIDAGRIILEMGYPLTGVTFDGPLPKTEYELRLESMRLDGIDFFCGLTFPVADEHCSFIVSGWAGAVVGLSSIDGRDASENETTRYMNFQDGQWYKIRVRVTQEKIECWIDDQQVVDQKTLGRRISTRVEVDLSKPLGISAYETTAALRNIQFRELPAK